MGIPKVIAEVEFNRLDDRKEFSDEPRIVSLWAYTRDDGQHEISLSFGLGRKEEDDVTLFINAEEFAQKLIEALINSEDLRGD